MSRLDELSIIIVTWKGDDLLRDCLASLAQAVGTAPEIVVVDNAAEESTHSIVSGFRNAMYVPSPGNPGFAAANNIGLAATTRPYILLLNNDTVTHADSFTPLIEFLNEHPRVGIVQGTMNIPGFGLDDCGVDLTIFGIQRHLNRGKSVEDAELRPRRVFAAKGAMLLFRREVLRDTGFLFHDHFRSYYEETDFCHRARNAGWETWFVPTPPIDHFGGRTASRFPAEEIFAQYFRNIFYSFHRNFGFWGHVFTIPCFFFAALIRSPRALFRAMAALSGISSQTAVEFLRYVVVGGLAFLADVGTLVFCREVVFHDWGEGVYISVMIAFLAGHVVNYLGSLWFVFRDPDERRNGLTWNAFWLFAVVGASGAGMTELGMWVGYGLLGMNYVLTKVLVAAVVFVWNFIGRKLVVRKKGE